MPKSEGLCNHRDEGEGEGNDGWVEEQRNPKKQREALVSGLGIQVTGGKTDFSKETLDRIVERGVNPLWKTGRAIHLIFKSE